MNQRRPPRPPLVDRPHADPSPAPPAVVAQGDPTPVVPYPLDDAVLQYRDLRLALSGRALHQILWLAAHHTVINGVASESGQLWLTWKGSSIAGEIRTRL